MAKFHGIRHLEIQYRKWFPIVSKMPARTVLPQQYMQAEGSYTTRIAFLESVSVKMRTEYSTIRARSMSDEFQPDEKHDCSTFTIFSIKDNCVVQQHSHTPLNSW